LLVFRGARGGNQGGIDDCALLHGHAMSPEVIPTKRRIVGTSIKASAKAGSPRACQCYIRWIRNMVSRR
jgi:hypothetical protein